MGSTLYLEDHLAQTGVGCSANHSDFTHLPSQRYCQVLYAETHAVA